MNRTAGRRLGAAAAAVGLMGAAVAADPAPAARSWSDRLTGKPLAAPVEPDGTFGGTPPKPTTFAPLDATVQAAAVQAEQAALVRRMEVCDKLRQVAAARNDDKLLARADELEKLAGAVYEARTARLGVKDAGGVK